MKKTDIKLKKLDSRGPKQQVVTKYISAEVNRLSVCEGGGTKADMPDPASAALIEHVSAENNAAWKVFFLSSKQYFMQF